MAASNLEQTSLEEAVQTMFERELSAATRPPPERVKANAAALRQRHQLVAQLAAGREVQHEAATGAGRLMGVAVQPRQGRRAAAAPAWQPASATVWALVQPTPAAGLRSSYSAEPAGFCSASLSGFADASRHSGVDCDLDVQQNGAWNGEAKIAQRLPALPLTLQHAVRAEQAQQASPSRRRLRLRHTTSLAIPLPRTSAELCASLAVPTALDLEHPEALLDRGGGGSSSEEPRAAAARAALDRAAAGEASTGPSNGTEQPARQPSPGSPLAVGRRKLTLTLRPQQLRKDLSPPATPRSDDGESSSGGSCAAGRGPSGSGGRRRSYLPHLQVEAELPEAQLGWAGWRQGVRPQDLAASWRQAWGPHVSSSLSWRHVGSGGRGARGGGARRRSSEGVQGMGAAGPALRHSALCRSTDSVGSESSTSSSSSSSVGDCSLAASPFAAEAGQPAAAAPAAAAGTSPRLQCELKCSLGPRLAATATTTLDAAALRPQSNSSGGGWALLPARRALAGAVQSAGLKLRCKLGGGGGKGAGGRRAVTLEGCYRGSGLSYCLGWELGPKTDAASAWDLDRPGSELRLRVQAPPRLPPQPERISLDFSFFLPL